MSGIIQDFVVSSAGAATKCADVVFDPDSGDTPLTIMVSTTTSNAHIFYRKGGSNPQHMGDSAISPTVRIGSNSGAISTGSGASVIRAIAYEPSHLDSNITQGVYTPAVGG